MTETDARITIEVDQDVWAALKADAEPFIDTPNDVLRRKLGLAVSTAPVASPNGGRSTTGTPGRRRSRRPAGARGRRAPRGSLLPEEAYETPILQVLESNGGRVPASEVISQVGDIVEEQLTALDREHLQTGDLRWHKRVQFTRLRLVERGLVRKDSPRGLWEITAEGQRALSAASGR
jgi:Mrr N-terminal domain